jgi:poly-gamma-glutamate synthesis protein (capsule biosynthesis protein)
LIVAPPFEQRGTVRLFLCGDVMLGRGIDQMLQWPCDPALHEDYVSSAMDYVALAERAHGLIPRGAPGSYIWGAALDELARNPVDLRIVNLETSVTRSEDYERKGINYRVSPENADCLRSARIDCCTLANNHVLDWGEAGLRETLSTLQRLGIKTAGVGADDVQAAAPAVLPIFGGRRVLVYAFASTTSGTPRRWAATSDRPGVNVLPDLSRLTTDGVIDRIIRDRTPDDIVVVSVHWGANWGYEIDDEQTNFAHALIDRAGVSVIHGHSSHHAKAIEAYGEGLILYGCGDFINDYEGISGYERYRGDLSLMYLVAITPSTGAVVGLDLVPLQMRQFRLVRVAEADVDWLQKTLARESRPFGAQIVKSGSGRLSMRTASGRSA